MYNVYNSTDTQFTIKKNLHPFLYLLFILRSMVIFLFSHTTYLLWVQYVICMFASFLFIRNSRKRPFCFLVFFFVFFFSFIFVCPLVISRGESGNSRPCCIPNNLYVLVHRRYLEFDILLLFIWNFNLHVRKMFGLFLEIVSMCRKVQAHQIPMNSWKWHLTFCLQPVGFCVCVWMLPISSSPNFLAFHYIHLSAFVKIAFHIRNRLKGEHWERTQST